MKAKTLFILLGLLFLANQKLCGKDQIQIGTACVCVAGYYRDSQGKCRACPLDSDVSADQTTCNCFNGYFDEGQKKCITKCALNEQFINGKCQCVGYVTSAGDCMPCPTNSSPSPDQTTCICDNQLLKFTLIYNVCYLPCPTFNGQCICPPLYRYYGPGLCLPM